jgi:hypothetical protein
MIRPFLKIETHLKKDFKGIENGTRVIVSAFRTINNQNSLIWNCDLIPMIQQAFVEDPKEIHGWQDAKLFDFWAGISKAER